MHRAMHISLPAKKRFDGDHFFAAVTRILAGLMLLLFVAVVFSLIERSGPSLFKFGLSFIWLTQWSPSTQEFGAMVAIIGTLVTSVIAMMIAIPLSFAIAITITEWLTSWLGTTLARLVELMAGIPSIIYGMWGLFVFAPFLADHIQPELINTLGQLPILKYIFGGLPIGIGVFTAGIVLALMVIPLISSMMRDVMSNVPVTLKEAAYGAGATRLEVIWHIIVPYTRAGMLGSVILGLGRALGETMAVTFVIGNSHQLFTSLFMPGTTISATIANEFTEAYGDLYRSSLMELGLILFVITFIVLAISRALLKHAKTRGGSQ